MIPKNTAKIKLIASMFIFGTVGIFRNYIPYPSSVIALVRGAIGILFLILMILISRQKIKFSSIKGKLPILCLSGAFIGANWILLFESYRYTTVATATLCYYMAPIFIIIASPFILKERLTIKKICCAVSAVIGMIIISGIFTSGASDIKGILLGLGAAVLYAAAVILNKFIKDISDYERTVFQLGTAAFAIFPYVIITEDISAISFDIFSVIMLVIVGILHTGIAYTLYFGSINKIKVQTAAIFSYIDPVVALFLSALILKEAFTLMHLVGSILILGAALISELPERKNINIFNKK